MYIHDIRLYKVFTYRKSSIKPAPPPPPQEGRNRDHCGRPIHMVSVLHKELECKVKKLKYKKVGGHASEDRKQI